MADEPKEFSERPKLPPKGYRRPPLSGPRDISAEVRGEMGVSQNNESKDPIIEINRELFKDLSSLIPGDDKNVVAQFDYMNEGDKLVSSLMTFDVRRVLEGDINTLIVSPHVVNAEDGWGVEGRQIATSKGVIPEFFVDNNGNNRYVSIEYKLLETGVAQKKIFISRPFLQSEHWGNNLPKYNYSNDTNESFIEVLNSDDYEQLKAYGTLGKQGKLQITQIYNYSTDTS